MTTAGREPRPDHPEGTVPVPELRPAERARVDPATDRHDSPATTLPSRTTGELPAARSPVGPDAIHGLGASPAPAGSGARTPTGAGDMPAAREARRARLLVRRIDPWSVLKTTIVYALCLLVVLLVAVAALYGVLSAMGVFDSINSAVRDLTDSGGSGSTGGLQVIFSARRILLWTALLGLANVVLASALATLAAFLYNLCADMVGGVEVTLAEQE